MATHPRSIGARTGQTVAAIFVVALVLVVSAQTPTPQRIISLVPSITEMLSAIGAGPQLVGIGSFDRLPTEHGVELARVGGLLDPDMERIFTLRPDLVALYGSQADLRQQLERAGIPVLIYAHGGLPEVSQTIRTLGVRTGHAAQAETIADRMEAGLTDIRARVAGRPRPRTLLVFGREPLTLRNIYASGGIGFLHDMLDTAGGDNVFEEVRSENVAQISSETILASAPEVIIEFRYHGDLGEDAVENERAVWRRLSTLPAVRRGRIHFITGNRFVVPGPGVVDATEELARILHPAAFATPRTRPEPDSE